MVRGSYKYTKTAGDVTSTWSGEFNLSNAYSAEADVISGQASFVSKLNGAEYNDTIILAPMLTISGSEDEPSLEGEIAVTRKAGSKVAEQAEISVALKRTEPLIWMEREYVADLSGADDASLAAFRAEAENAIAASLVRPLIVRMGKDGEWFFRDIPEEAVQSIIDAANSIE